MPGPVDHALDRYFAGDDRELAELANRGVGQSDCEHGYPNHHRICDVRLDSGDYRVARCVLCDAAFIEPIDVFAAEPGVPWALRGDRLRAWVADEVRRPTKGPIDWAWWLDATSVGRPRIGYEDGWEDADEIELDEVRAILAEAETVDVQPNGAGAAEMSEAQLLAQIGASLGPRASSTLAALKGRVVLEGIFNDASVEPLHGILNVIPAGTGPASDWETALRLARRCWLLRNS